jgi:hypothetical protein
LNKKGPLGSAAPSVGAGRKRLPLPDNDPECIPALLLSTSR